MSNKYRLFILILISVILINFVYEQKVKAEAITITAGLYVFLQAAYAAGLTYLGTEAVNRLVEDSNVLYVEFKKHIENKPPEEKPPHDWEKTAILTMLGLQLGDSFKRLVDSVKDFFQELGAKEGENSYTIGGYLDLELYTVTDGYVFNTRPISYVSGNREYKDTYSRFEFRLVGSTWKVQSYRIGKDRPLGSKIEYIPFEYNSGESTVKYKPELGYYHISFQPAYDKVYNFKFVNPDEPVTEIPPERQIIYNITNNSYLISNNPYDIKPVSPNLSVLPKEKLVEDNGKIVYEGTQEDLVNDLIANADPDNLFDTNPNPQPIEEIAPGKIVIGDSPGANPDPGTEPGTNPDPGTDPNDLLDKVFDPDTKEKLDTDKLKKERNFTTRFPFSIPWDIARVIRLFAKSPSPPDLGVNIDTTHLKVNYDINLSQIDLPIRFFRYAATAWFILFLASKTRDLIKW